jgi:hypothetical protein
VEANRSLGDTNLYLYGIYRGTMLFGTATQSATVQGGPGLSVSQASLSSAYTLLPTGEMELGMGWARGVGRTHLTVRTGLVGQVWYEAGNASRSSVQFLGVGPLANNSTLDSNLGLFGFTVRVGVDY